MSSLLSLSSYPLPLALYIHWPFCKSKCPYCDFNSHVREAVDEQAWEQALLSELAWNATQLPGRQLVSIFFGGGTPSLMRARTVAALIDAARKHWHAALELEITLEANPTSVEAAKLQAFRDAGVNRVSLGVQAMNDADLKFLGRQHSVKEALSAVETAAKIFPRYSFDLIYARPGQTPGAWKRELNEALGYASGHFSLYQLTIEENTVFHHAYHQQHAFALPEDEDAARMYELTQETMESHGLPAYEISNHAKPGEECIHNLAYWRGWEYAGVGPGAHGRIDSSNHRTATEAQKSPERWLEQVAKAGHAITQTPLTEQERLEERLMMGLRLREGMPVEEIHRLAEEAKMDLHSRLGELTAQHLLEEKNTMLMATAQGRLVLQRIITELVK